LETNSPSRQEIPHSLGNQQVYYCDNKHSLLASVLNKMYLVHALTPSFFKSILLVSTHLVVSYQSGLFPS